MDEIGKYESLVEKTSIFPEDRGLEYLSLGLTSEAGEVAAIIKRIIRDSEKLNRNDLIKELGDCLWYITNIANKYCGVSLGHVMHMNMEKLKSRYDRGVIKGRGDNR